MCFKSNLVLLSPGTGIFINTSGLHKLSDIIQVNNYCCFYKYLKDRRVGLKDVERRWISFILVEMYVYAMVQVCNF